VAARDKTCGTMTPQPWRARSRAWAVSAGAHALGGLLCLGALSCSGTQPEHGSPVLTQVYWIVGGTQTLVWSRASDPTLASAAPPLASEVDFVFDRRLDGDRIEDTVTVGGVTTTQPKAKPPIVVQWSDMAAETRTTPFALAVAYNSAPRYGDQSSYVFARPTVPGFPSSQTLTFDLDLANLAGAYGEPGDAPTQIPVKTTSFSVGLANPGAGVAGSYALPLAFSSRLAPLSADATSPFIHVTAGGLAVPYKLLADANVASTLYVAPAECLGVWTANTKFIVTIDAGFLDAFGGALPEGETASFTTGASSGTTSPSTCPGVTADAATEDAATDATTSGDADAAFDGGAPDADTSDAGDATSPADGGADLADAAAE
jgi:hypothetical protein